MASSRKIIVVVGATGAQGGGLVRAILDDASGEFAVQSFDQWLGANKARIPLG